MTGRRLVASLFAIVLATAILPPAAAHAINQRRVVRATADVARIAAQLGIGSGDRGVLAGPGRLPAADAAAGQWLAEPRRALVLLGQPSDVRPDPWGNGYLAGGDLVLSAGPNGIIQTAYGASAPGGDDVVAYRR